VRQLIDSPLLKVCGNFVVIGSLDLEAQHPALKAGAIVTAIGLCDDKDPFVLPNGKVPEGAGGFRPWARTQAKQQGSRVKKLMKHGASIALVDDARRQIATVRNADAEKNGGWQFRTVPLHHSSSYSASSTKQREWCLVNKAARMVPGENEEGDGPCIRLGPGKSLNFFCP
jgi:hypothetical protein